MAARPLTKAPTPAKPAVAAKPAPAKSAAAPAKTTTTTTTKGATLAKPALGAAAVKGVSAAVPKKASGSLVVASALGPGNGAVIDVDKLNEMRASMLSDIYNTDATDSDLKNKQQTALQLTIPIFVVGVSSKGGQFTGVVPHLGMFKDLVDGAELEGLDGARPYVETIVDIRTKDQRTADEANGLALEDSTAHPADEVAGQLDDVGEIRRVIMRFESFGVLRLLNKVGDGVLKPNTFAVIKVEPGAWHDKVTKRVVILSKLVGVISSNPIPIGAFVKWMHASGAWTKHFKTMAAHYNQAMQGLHVQYNGNIPDGEAKALRYRSDNQLLLAIGFGHGAYLDRQMLQPNSCIYRDTTVNDSKNFEGVNKDNKAVKENRYMMELTGVQWTNDDGDEGGAYGDTARKGKFIVKVAFWKESIDKMEIRSITAWRDLGPVNMPYLKALVMAKEDAMSSAQNALTRERINIQDPDLINEPPADGRVGFVMGTYCDSVMFDPVDFVQTVSIPVSPAAIKALLWKNKSIPIVEADAPNTTLDVNKRLLCLSEMKNDVARVLNSPNYTFHVMTNARGNEVLFSQDEFGKLSVADGDIFLAYLVNQYVNMSIKTREQYLAERKLKLAPTHIINRFTYQFVGSKKLLYVFAINTSETAKVHEEFAEYAAGLKLTGVTAASFLSSDAAPVAIAAPPLMPQGTKRPAPVAKPSGAVQSAAKRLRPADGGAPVDTAAAPDETPEANDDPNAELMDDAAAEDEPAPKTAEGEEGGAGREADPDAEAEGEPEPEPDGEDARGVGGPGTLDEIEDVYARAQGDDEGEPQEEEEDEEEDA